MKIEKLKEKFKKGTFIPNKDTTIEVEGMTFQFSGSTSYPFADVMSGKLGMMKFNISKDSTERMKLFRTTIKETDNDTINNVMIFASQVIGGKLYPLGVKFSSGSGDGLFEAEQRDDNIIGDKVDVKITNLPFSKTLKGRVDTGASLCSLHADKWKISDGQVKFICKELSDNVITVKQDNQQAVKTPDGGVEYRPVILLNIKINGKMLSDVQFNLNNRDHMDDPILIGQNALEKGKFLIDPSINEKYSDMDWNEYAKLFEDCVVEDLDEGLSSEAKLEKANEIVDMMIETNLSFREVIQILNTKVANKNIEY